MENQNSPGLIPVDEDYGRYHIPEEEDRDGSSMYSIASSTHNFIVEHGRRYHDYKEGHPFPHDAVSRENETLMHEMCLLLFDNEHFLSPIAEPSLHAVADVGTGLGLWAEGVAERYPDTQVVGMDLTPRERTTHPNCEFMITDATEEWVLDTPTMKFDLVHIRYLFAGVRDWTALYKHCFENLNSGGWIEQAEVEVDAFTDDTEILPNSQVRELCELAREMKAATGRDFNIAVSMKREMELAGFVDIQEQRHKIPLGPWATDPKLKDIGRLFERFYKTGLQGWLLQICTRQLGWSVEQVNDACAKAFQEVNARQQHWYYHMVTVFGRKP